MEKNMKTLLIISLIVFGILAILVVSVILLTPWMDGWGATQAEIDAAYSGDELLREPARIVNRAITIQAPPEQIYPWIIQMGADKGGMYSYTWIENLINCRQANADRIHSEWQGLKAGDLVRMCPGEFGPVPFTVALLQPSTSVVMGHQENGVWVDLWQFVIQPLPNGASRLILRTRTNMTGGIWSIIHPGIFIMERGMLIGIKDRTEAIVNH
jgi:hypothetical protein